MKDACVIAESVARASAIGSYTDDSRQAPWQQPGCAHHQQVVAENPEEAVAVCRILRPQAQIHKVHAMLPAPRQCAENHADVRRQPSVENLDRIQLGVRGFFANGAGDRRAVSQPVDRVHPLAVERDFNRAGDLPNIVDGRDEPRCR